MARAAASYAKAKLGVTAQCPRQLLPCFPWGTRAGLREPGKRRACLPVLAPAFSPPLSEQLTPADVITHAGGGGDAPTEPISLDCLVNKIREPRLHGRNHRLGSRGCAGHTVARVSARCKQERSILNVRGKWVETRINWGFNCFLCGDTSFISDQYS